MDLNVEDSVTSVIDEELERSKDLIQAWQSGMEEAPEERDLPTPVQVEAE